jgi:hypothetical protein
VVPVTTGSGKFVPVSVTPAKAMFAAVIIPAATSRLVLMAR